MEENKNVNIFKLVFDNAPFGIYTLNKDGVIDSFNPRMVEMAGSKSADSVIGLNVFSMGSYKEAGLDVFFHRGLNGEMFEKEVKYVSQTGNIESWRHYRGIPFFSINNSVVGLLLIVEDITERKILQDEIKKYTTQLEDEIKKRTGELVSLEKQYEVVVEKSLVGTSIIQDNVFKYVSPMFLKIFGYDKKEEVIGSEWKKIIFKDDILLVENTGIQERMTGNGESKVYTVRGVKKNGEIINLEISSSSAIFNGRPALVGSLQDITERVNLEQTNKKHFEEIEKMNKFMVNRELRMIELKKEIERLKENCK